MTYRQKEAGQALIIVVLGIVVLIGALGLGIDMGVYRYQKRQLQTAADAAALAGAQAYLKSSTQVSTAANLALTNNGYGTSSGTVATINNPPSCTTGAPCNLPAPDPNIGKTNYVEVLLNQNEPTYFSKIFGVSSVPLTARAEAEANNNCIYTLNGSGTDVQVFLAVVTTDCGVVDESTSNPDFNCTIGLFSAPSVELANPGKSSGFACFGLTKPRDVSLPTTPYDPMKYLQSYEPAVLPCGSSVASPYAGHNGLLTINNATPVTLNAGIYCGGITFGTNANVTLGGGTYVITQTTAGNGLIFNAGINTINGSAGETFYMNSGAVLFNFSSFSFSNGGITLTAPTSGSVSTGNYPGILFFQPPTNTSASQVVGSFAFNQSVTGGYYMPTANLTYVFDFVNSAPGEYAPMVVSQLSFWFSGFVGTPTLRIFNRPPTSTSPLASSAAVLVE